MYTKNQAPSVFPEKSPGIPARTAHPKDFILTCGVVAVLFALAVNAANAQTVTKSRTTDRQFTGAVDNPCNGDRVSFQGTKRTETFTEQTNNVFRFEFRDDEQAKGSGTPSGKAYGWRATARNRVRSSDKNFVFRFSDRRRLNCQGCPPPPDDFFARVETRCDGQNGCVVEQVRNEAGCK